MITGAICSKYVFKGFSPTRIAMCVFAERPFTGSVVDALREKEVSDGTVEHGPDGRVRILGTPHRPNLQTRMAIRENVPVNVSRQSSFCFKHQGRRQWKVGRNLDAHLPDVYWPFRAINLKRPFEHDRKMISLSDPQADMVHQRRRALVKELIEFQSALPPRFGRIGSRLYCRGRSLGEYARC